MGEAASSRRGADRSRRIRWRASIIVVVLLAGCASSDEPPPVVTELPAPRTDPAAPLGIEKAVCVAGSGLLYCLWNVPTDPRVAGFRLAVGEPGAAPAATVETGIVDSYRHRGLENGRSYEVTLSALGGSGGEIAATTLPAVTTGARAPRIDPHYFRPWKWRRRYTQESLLQEIQDMESVGAPCGTVIVDAPWHSCLCSFEPGGDFWDLAGLLRVLEEREIRGMAWMTPHINRSCGLLYDHAREQGYFRPGAESVDWWLGTGGLIDMDDPAAVTWWHGLLERAAELGFHGFKVDAPAPLHLNSAYQESFYEEIFGFCLARWGEEGTSFARALGNTGLHGVCNTDDRSCDFAGLSDAIAYVFDAADRYPYIGSDIGGWKPRAPGSDRPTDELFCRWVQFGALCPIMQTGGYTCREPWDRSCWDDPDLVLDVYLRYARLHEELIPYLTALAEENHATGSPLIRPLRREPFTYQLGPDLVVAPVHMPGARSWTVELPPGDWESYWDRSYATGTVTVPAPLDEIPLFLRVGSEVLP